MSMRGDALDPDMLSAYLDGELTDAERVAVDAQLEASAEWRDELAEVRAARDAVRGVSQREAPAGFWDAVHASVVADDAPDAADREVVVPITAARVHATALGLGGGVSRGRGRRGRGDRRPAPQRGVAERGRGGRAARRAGVRQRRSGEHACTRRSARRVPPVTGLRRPSTIALCALATFALAWPIAASAGAGDSADAQEAVRLVRGTRDAAADHDFSGDATVTWTTPTRTEKTQVRVTDVGGAVTITTTGGTTVVDEGRRTYLRDRLGWTGLVVEPTAHDLPSPNRRWRLSTAGSRTVADRPGTVVLATRPDGKPAQRLVVDDATGLLLGREVLGPRGQVERSVRFSSIEVGERDAPRCRHPPTSRAAPRRS